MSNALSYIAQIDFLGVYWLTFLRNKIAQTGNFIQDDIEHAFDNLFNSDSVTTNPTNPQIANRQINTSKQALKKTYENKNVAGLFNDRELIFSPLITIIYGKNGTGKTTFYKVLKDAFHSKQDIKGDIYGTSNEVPNAKMIFTDLEGYKKWQRKGITYDTSSDEEIHWQVGHAFPKNIKFCDDKILEKSLEKKESGWSVDRFQLSAFANLTKAIEEVEQKIKTKIHDLEREFTTLFDVFCASLSNNHEVKMTNFDKKNLAKWQSFLSICVPENFIELQNQYERERSLNANDYAEKLKNLEIDQNEIAELKKYLEKKEKFLSGIPRLNEIIERVCEIKASRDYSHFEQFNLLFNPNEQDNQEKFLQLIEKIAETALVFNKENYPKNVEKCFYCNQTLNQDAKSLITKIHQLIDNELEKELREKENKLTEIIGYIDKNLTLPTITEGLVGKLTSKGLIVNEVFENSLMNSCKNAIQNCCAYVSDQTILSKIESFKIALESLASEDLEAINTNKTSINEIESKRKEAEKALFQLLDNKFLSENHARINNMIALITEIKNYQDKSNLSNVKKTVSIALKKAEKELVTDSYIRVFDEHLNHFQLRNKEKLKRTVSVEKGKSQIDAKIKGEEKEFSAKEILSEGEAKVHAICDWLAELDFTETTTIIFDDPITSLDETHIEIFTEKILGLVGRYQVIVFTHNFPFYENIVTKTLGKRNLENSKCGVCNDLSPELQCDGYTNHHLLKCASYYKIESKVQAGFLNNKIEYFRFGYKHKIDNIRLLLASSDQGTDTVANELRIVINVFFQEYVLENIHKVVIESSHELIAHWDKIRRKNFTNSDHEILRELQHRLSSRGTSHESMTNQPNLGTQDLINIFNSFIEVVNRYDTNGRLVAI